jgi:hypothetical protein
LRFGLEDGKPLGLSDISAKFGVEKERIKNIEARAVEASTAKSKSGGEMLHIRSHIMSCGLLSKELGVNSETLKKLIDSVIENLISNALAVSYQDRSPSNVINLVI